MTNLKITAGIIQEIIDRDLDLRIQQEPDNPAMDIYRKIRKTPVTRKDGSINIEVTEAELQELYAEADFSGDFRDASDPTLGYIKAWAALARQIRKVR